jgi:hypothetical protein
MCTTESTAQWAHEVFEQTDLGHVRRTKTLIRLVARLAQRPKATLSDVFHCPRELQAAYDFVENSAVSAQAIVHAAACATARRAAPLPLVLLAGDGVQLSYRDLHHRRDLGSVGHYRGGARGLHAMDAVAMDEHGAVLGLAGLVTWTRADRPVSRHCGDRPVEQRESFHWLSLRRDVRAAFREHAPDTIRVFLHDTGADAWFVLWDTRLPAPKLEYNVVRSTGTRHAGLYRDGTLQDVDSTVKAVLRKAPLRTRRRVRLGAGHGRTPRRALLEYRAVRVTLGMELRPRKVRAPAVVYALWVRERGHVPAGQERLEWILLTDWPVTTVAAMLRVVGWYLLRWRVEDHHKVWKKGGQNIEEAKLGRRANLERWMAMHAAVSARTLSVLHAARDPVQSAQPASTVFSDAELTALRALRAYYNDPTPETLTVVQAADLIASYGGYAPQKGRRYGPKTLGRGMEQVLHATVVLLGMATLEKRQRKRR